MCLENTHNTAGGTVYPLEDFAAVAGAARELGLKVHLDGARLFNAQAATGIPAREWCEHADTVSVCSSKGLGAPVGSLLAGDEETIGEARRARKAFGGGMRQAGVIAAASLYAFEHHVERLAEDHERARKLADGLREAGYAVEPPETNLVLVEVERPEEFLRGPRPRRRARHPGQARLRPSLHPPRCRGRGDRGGRRSGGQNHRQRRRALSTIEVASVPGTELAELLALLEESLRDGEPVPVAFAERFRETVEARRLEVLAARVEDRVVGVAVIAYRLSVSAGGLFASIEDLYVSPESRRRGVGRALLGAIGERCEARGISYVEAQVEEDGAEAFYAALGYEREPGVRVLSKSLPIIDGPKLEA